MNVLVIAPHPDDEVLGAGGTIARLSAERHHVVVAIVTRGMPELFDQALIEQGREEAVRAHAILGVAETRFMDFPAAQLDTVPHHRLNAGMLALVGETRPEMVLIPFRDDLHLDHRLVFDSALVAVRPTPGSGVREVYAYETLSETNWNASRSITAPFVPDLYVRIDDFLDRKLEAMRAYASQLREFPDERSIGALEALARSRGATVGCRAAEALMTIRRLL